MRSFSPEDEVFRWDDLEQLPRVGELFFELAEMVGGTPVARELDAVVMRKNELGVLVQEPFPIGERPNPILALKKLSSIRHYRAVRMAESRGNVVVVSRVTAASAQELHRRLPAAGVTARQANGVRGLLGVIHYKLGNSYLGTVHDPNFSIKNGKISDIYVAVGRLVRGGLTRESGV